MVGERWPVSQLLPNVGYLVAVAAVAVLSVLVVVRLGLAVAARVAALLVPALAARAVAGPVGPAPDVRHDPTRE